MYIICTVMNTFSYETLYKYQFDLAAAPTALETCNTGISNVILR